MTDRSARRKKNQADGEISAVEWVLAGLSAVLVLAVIGALLYEGLRGAGSPPEIVFEVDSVRVAPHGFLLEFQAVNSGESTAARLLIEGEVSTEAGVTERSEVTIDYLPAKSRRRAWLFFETDPSQHHLEIRQKGFDSP